MQITTAALFFFAALGVVANPIESKSNGIATRDDNSISITYEGKCYKEKNECKYENDKGKDTFVKCPTKFANKKCTKDLQDCTYDSVSKAVTCD